jgi:hypothetical protein
MMVAMGAFALAAVAAWLLPEYRAVSAAAEQPAGAGATA